MTDSVLPSRPSLIEHPHARFLIIDAPTNQNVHLYVQELKKYDVKHVVRVCDPTYSTAPFVQNGLTVHDWPFADGQPPPADTVTKWLELVKREFHGKPPTHPIAVHCVAGLGRAPVLVAIALVELGLQPLDAVETIRARRRGALNSTQLQFIEKYVPTSGKGENCRIL
eukprot:gnl/Hemi2/11525_TR3981_c0_g1_i1.p1 gnl/Hemi2/11525_TR3981_c0_g1~~gnl/Hemi2/11525_TR3981_c0_g1_i1.p1  ORF type:complete len:168 (+),score=14.80 gnl/Hemi2/11525_TR3981_c0_g1_i1:67-570(+)